MGKGLLPKPSGMHVGFAAGTGVLVFMDLVAYLIRQDLSIPGNDSSQDKLLEPDFKFVLYAKFPSEKQAVGLELLRAADARLDRFELRLSFGNESF